MNANVLATIVAAALAAALPYVAALSRGRSRAKRVQARWDEPRVTNEARTGATVLIEGTLASPEESAPAAGTTPGGGRSVLLSTTLPRGGELLEEVVDTAATEERGSVVVLVGNEPVGLTKPQVLVGSTELVETSTLNATRTLAAGDRVVARGVLRTVPAEVTGHYRERKVRQELVPSDGYEVVAIAFRGTPRPKLRGKALQFAAPAMGAIAWLAGSHFVSRALPSKPGCPGDLDRRIAYGDLQKARADADACDDLVRAAQAAWLAGDFGETSRAFSTAAALRRPFAPSITVVAAHLLAGRYAESATAARAIVVESRDTDPVDRNVLECYSDALEVRTGNEEARRRLTTRANDAQMPTVCGLLLADSLNGSERIQFVDAHYRPRYPGQENFGYTLYGPRERDEYAYVHLRAESTRADVPKAPDFYPFRVLGGAKEQAFGVPLGLVFDSDQRDASGDWTAYAVLRASYASYAGEHGAAAQAFHLGLQRAALEAYRFGSERSTTFEYAKPDDADLLLGAGTLGERQLAQRRLLFTGAVLATRARQVEAARQLLAMASEEAHGKALLEPYLKVLSASRAASAQDALSALERAESWEPHKVLWQLARRGDGAGLVAELERRAADGRGVLPYVAHLEELAPALRGFLEREYPRPCWTCGPHVLFDALAGERELAQAVHNEDREARISPAIARLREAFGRRELAMPLYALARVSLKLPK